MPFRKSWLVKDAETGEQVWTNGRGTYLAGTRPDARFQAEVTAEPDTPERREVHRKRIEAKCGRPVVLVEGPMVEYFDVF